MIKKRKILLTGIAALGLAVTAACSSGDGSSESSQNNEETSQEQTENQDQQSESEQRAEEQQTSTELNSNSDLKSQLESEESVQEATVQEVNGENEQQVNIDITIASNQELTEELKTTYSDMIRQVYPDQNVSLIYAKGGELLEQTTLE
ncbi:hypothetical protein [Salibacterium halotolerans]|uniref:Sporulation lipoprotein YhcN/YlaJ (Spore_YhcN_YlaJ) n=1 Tax=Salibacterium halotolerans TaxID=1884432 RepID=A0A1I5KZE6_9BACI|nr:hypothetical protein [Salibacterium halotolerans]SFO90278.1 hypothetical protein SAMN05518683_10138 [Salibacterium halotolerans]